MISLKDLQNRKSITVKDWTTKGHIRDGLQVIMTDVNVLTSVVLYNLLFRLEGIFEQGNKVPEINLIDKGTKVTEKDIIIGNFIQEDVSKNMVDALIERYQGVFTTSIYKVQETEDFIQSLMNDEDNKIVIGMGKQTENSNKIFNDLMMRRIKKRKFGGVMRIHGMSTGDEVSVYTSVLTKQNSVLGERNIKKEDIDRKKAEQIIMENQIIANTVVMLMNTMVTEDESIKGNPYKKWTQDIITGETTSEYHEKGTTIFHERGYMGNFIMWNVKDEIINVYDGEFKKYVKETRFEGDREELQNVSHVWEKLISRKILKDNKKKLMIYEREEMEKMMVLIILKRLAVSDKEKYAVLKMLEDNLRMSELV